MKVRTQLEDQTQKGSRRLDNLRECHVGGSIVETQGADVQSSRPDTQRASDEDEG